MVAQRVVTAFSFWVLVAGSTACVESGASKNTAGVVLLTEAPFGPSIVFDALADPVPEVPFPNDVIMTRTDVGPGWNISELAPTSGEARVRARLNTLEGFGVFAPITVPFDAPIVLDSVTEETFIVVNIEPGHPNVGERVHLDLGAGYFPLQGGGRFWPNDANGDLRDFLLPRDNDAFWNGEFQRVEHYEVATDTLIVRPVTPLEPAAQYAVLITRGVLGDGVDKDGASIVAPVRSPFAFKAHAAQTEHVARALELTGVTTDELAFGWTFTTRDVTAPYKTLRDSLHGGGLFPEWADEFPPRLTDIRDNNINHDGGGFGIAEDAQDSAFILQSEFMEQFAGVIGSFAPEFSIGFNHIDYLVFGDFESPRIREDEHHTLSVDLRTGRGAYGVETVPFMASVPKPNDFRTAPYPVVIYFHGTGSSRFELIALANNLARFGVATIAFDQVGHGPVIPDIELLLADNGLDPELAATLVPLLANIIVPDRVDEFRDASLQEALAQFREIGFFQELATIGRTEDLDGDGALSSGESFFYSDPFAQCASFQQDTLDLYQLVRILRAFDPDGLPSPVSGPGDASREQLMPSLLSGDFNADGVLDFGGPDVAIGVAGTSLGGIHSVLAAATEPEISTVTPIVAGGGLADILVRSSLRNITRVIYLHIFGPLVVGCPDGAGGFWLSFNDEAGGCGADQALGGFARLSVPGGIPSNAELVIVNERNSEERRVDVTTGEGFSVGIPADRWDSLHIQLRGPDGVLAELRVDTPYDGSGFERNTPDFRRFVGITQHALDSCDPIAFARHLFLDPLPGHQPKHTLFEFALGDTTVPISSGVNLARVAGTLGTSRSEWEPTAAFFIEQGVMVGSDYDPEDIAEDNPADASGIGPTPAVASGNDGFSAARFAAVSGNHTYIAGGGGATSFDFAEMSRNRMALFHALGARVVVDDPCISDAGCESLDAPQSYLP